MPKNLNLYINNLHILLYLLWAYTFFALECSPDNKNKTEVINIDAIINVVETDSKIFISEDSTIFFSSDKNSYYNIFSFKNSSIHPFLISDCDVFSPFLWQTKINALKDQNGNEIFETFYKDAELPFNNREFKRLLSSADGKYLIAEYMDQPAHFFINGATSQHTLLAKYEKRFYGYNFSGDGKYLVLSYDDELFLYDIAQNSKKSLAGDMPGEKRNPFLFGDRLFFESETKSEFSQIYQTNINDINERQILVHASDHDLKMPQCDGKYLYFIEIIKSEYLLRRKNLQTGQVGNLTEKGVIYNYSLYGADKLILVYSDFITPKSLMLLNLPDRNMTNMSGASLDFKATFSFKLMEAGLSPAYIFKPPEKTKINGVILFFHPGLNSDFSPRWDIMLMALISQGYIIVAPNYPLSCGYGKKYRSASFTSAVTDMINWKHKLKIQYNDLPLYFISASSGNLLMEEVLNTDNDGVKAAAALFGLSRNRIPDYEIPLLYILGENDPVVNFSMKKEILQRAKLSNKQIEILSFPDEGHWFRRKNNLKDGILAVIKTFQ
jgi:pimeloyl-ACP methyl ester carboxylesterase